MAARGRKSAASTEIVIASSVEVVHRPLPPNELTPEQTEEWRAVVDRMPADWFPRETHGLLVQYCRHVVAARRIAQLINKTERAKAFDVDVYDKLLKMQEREGRAISSLATRMRITQQATVRAESARKPEQLAAPWEEDDEEQG
jgi:chaperone required for assembly of F1-ATPase